MWRVLVAGKIHAAGMEVLKGRPDLEVVVIDDPSAQIPAEEVARSNAVLIRYGVLSTAAVTGARGLRVVSRHGVGCDNLPVAALSALGIPVAIVGPVNAVSVAEQAFAMMLAAIKQVAQYDRAVRRGDWLMRDSLATRELAGKMLMLLGFGRVGREVAKRARAFDMDVLAFDPYVDSGIMEAAGARKTENWREDLARIDVLSIHLPLSAETRNIVDAGVLAELKPTAIVINTARGGLIDEDALYRALTTGMVDGAAALDTFAVEPPCADNPLFTLPNVVLSPHSASLTKEAAERMGVVAARNVIAGLEGTLDPELIFNRKALEAARIRWGGRGTA